MKKNPLRENISRAEAKSFVLMRSAAASRGVPAVLIAVYAASCAAYAPAAVFDAAPLSAARRRSSLTDHARSLQPRLAADAAAADAGAAAPGRGYGPLLQGPFDFPSAPRATLRRELVPNRIWSFEQVQGVLYVHVPVRMTAVALDGGGLFIYAPVAPTDECLRLLEEIEQQVGAVKHILLPSLALEHKSFAGETARRPHQPPPSLLPQPTTPAYDPSLLPRPTTPPYYSAYYPGLLPRPTHPKPSRP